MAPRVWAESEDKKFKWVTLESKHLRAALSVMRTSFFVNETISVVVEMSQSEKSCQQFEEFLSAIAEDGVSVVAIDTETDTVVGVALNKIQVQGDPDCSTFMKRYMNHPNTDAAFKELLNFVSQMEEKVDIFAHYGVTTILDHMFLATHVDYYLRGIGRGLVAATEDMARALNRGEDVTVPISEKYTWKNKTLPRVEAVIALFTSYKSQKIGKSLKWDEILITNYNDLVYRGRTYGSRLDENNQTNAYMSIKM
ncbi:uncharacterized protein [Periplaneta americana]